MLLHWPARTSHRPWAPAQRHRYVRDGYVVLDRLFARDECRRLVRHLGDLRAGNRRLGGLARQENQHLHDRAALRFPIDERLHRPLADCLGDEPAAIRTMLVAGGSERLLYQDQYDLPDCMSAWIALVDIDEDNGPLVVQPGSHTGRLVTESGVRLALRSGETRAERPHGSYFTQVREVFRENGGDVLRVAVNQGDVVLFHGRLIHGGAPARRPDIPRFALLCHYVPYHSKNCDRDWPRIPFDGTRRVHYRNGSAGN